jgi:hypothetical protein
MLRHLEQLSTRETAAVVEVRVTDPAEKALVDQYAVSRAPMPLILTVAPNGAVTGGFPSKLTEAQVMQAFVSPAVAQCLKAVQARKLVLLCVQPTPGVALPQGVRGFQADPQYRTATEVVTVQSGDAATLIELKRLPCSMKGRMYTAQLGPNGMVMSCHPVSCPGVLPHGRRPGRLLRWARGVAHNRNGRAHRAHARYAHRGRSDPPILIPD